MRAPIFARADAARAHAERASKRATTALIEARRRLIEARQRMAMVNASVEKCPRAARGGA
jgi:hypothetical protein